MAALKEEFHGPLAFALHGFAGLPFWLMLIGLGLAALLYLVLSPEWPTKLRRAFSPLVSVHLTNVALLLSYGFSWYGYRQFFGVARARDLLKHAELQGVRVMPVDGKRLAGMSGGKAR